MKLLGLLDGLTRWLDQMTSLSFLSQYCCASHHFACQSDVKVKRDHARNLPCTISVMHKLFIIYLCQLV